MENLNFLAEGKYYRTFKGQNCARDDILTNQTECKYATAIFGFNWDKTDIFDSRPAGCFYHDDLGYFNQLTNSSSTKPPSFFDSMGALCKRGMINVFAEFKVLSLNISMLLDNFKFQ